MGALYGNVSGRLYVTDHGFVYTCVPVYCIGRSPFLSYAVRRCHGRFLRQNVEVKQEDGGEGMSHTCDATAASVPSSDLLCPSHMLAP